jgi:hypothetical protein
MTTTTTANNGIPNPTATDSLGLLKLKPTPRKKQYRFTDDEWAQIENARARNVGWNEIQEAAPRYKSVEGLKTAYGAWKRASRGNEPQSPDDPTW